MIVGSNLAKSEINFFTFAKNFFWYEDERIEKP